MLLFPPVGPRVKVKSIESLALFPDRDLSQAGPHNLIELGARHP
jgi:hypothetical protein